MLTLGLWFLAAFGFCFVVGHSKISQGLRMLIGGYAVDDAVMAHARKAVVAEHRASGKRLPAAAPFTPTESQEVANFNALVAKRALEDAAPLIPFVGPWLAALFECVGCLGWWLGLVAGVSGFVPLGFELFGWSAGLLLAFATAGANLLLGKYVGVV